MGMIDREKIIQGLEFTKTMITFNPSTGEDIEPENLNELDKTSYDACVGAIALLKEQKTIVRCKDCKYWHDPIRCQLDCVALIAEQMLQSGKSGEIGMVLYRKVIRPMHCYPGHNYEPLTEPIEKEEKWYSEEEREYLEKKYASFNEGPFSDLVFEEKYEPYAFAIEPKL